MGHDRRLSRTAAARGVKFHHWHDSSGVWVPAGPQRDRPTAENRGMNVRSITLTVAKCSTLSATSRLKDARESRGLRRR